MTHGYWLTEQTTEDKPVRTTYSILNKKRSVGPVQAKAYIDCVY